MKKLLFFLVLFVTVLAGCGKKQQRTFTVINQSNWRVVVAVTNFIDDIGNNQSYGTYVIGEHNNLRGLPNQISFSLYEYGDCKLVSVNGAKIKSKTDTRLVLDDASPVTVNIVNQTGSDIIIQNEPWLGGDPVDFYYGGIYRDQYQILYNDYKPIFSNCTIITKDRTESNPMKIPVYAWQLFEITDPQKFTAFAHKYILITSNRQGLRGAWERVGGTFFLRITN